MHWITILLVLLPLLQTIIEGLPVRVDYDEADDDEWDEDFEDFEGPSYDDPKQYMKKMNKKPSGSTVWKVNLNHTSKLPRYYNLPADTQRRYNVSTTSF